MSGVFLFLVAATLAFVGTMVDNLLALAAQLSLQPRHRFRTISAGQTAGSALLVAASLGLARVVASVPVSLVGLAAVAPFWLAWRAWRTRHDEVEPSTARHAVTSFLATVALGGDNVAVWTPMFRAASGLRSLGLLVIFSIFQAALVALAWLLASHPRLQRLGVRSSRVALPGLYVLIGIVILLECGTVSL